MKSFRRNVFIIALLFMMLIPVLNYAKPRIAVITFDNKSGMWSGSLDDLAPNMLVTHLVRSDRFSVMERDRLDEILREQNLGVSGQVTPESAARIGRLLGVDFLITGTITKFTVEQRRAQFVVGSARRTVAETTLHVRAFNTTTGEIVFSEEASSDKSFSRVIVMGAGGGVDFDRGLAEDVLEGAIKSIGDKIIASDRFTGAGASYHLVARVSGDQIFINAGSNKGVNIGDTFHVKRNIEEIIDPATGQSLGFVTEDIGSIRVVNVTPVMATCEVISGGPFRQNDIVE